METILAAFIALAGTIIAALIGFRQWKKQQDASRLAAFQTERRHVYKELWDMLEEMHLNMRSDEMGREEFTSRITRVNSFVLKNSLYIDKKDSQLATQYINSVFELSKLIKRSRDKRAKRDWDITSELPPDTLAEADTIKAAWNTVNEHRDRVVAKFQRVLKGEK